MSTLKKQNIGFTQVSNVVLNDKKLSLKAKGLYSYLYSKPNNWDFSYQRIAKDTSDGEKAVLSGLKELEEIGYLLRQKLNNGRSEYHLLANINLTAVSASSPNGYQPKPQSAVLGTISNTDKKAIKNNNNTELQAGACESQTINNLLNLFKEINPTINFGNTTYRKSLEALVKKYGRDEADRLIRTALSVQGLRYAPTVTNPYQLINKMGDLAVYFKKENNNNPIIV